MIFAMQISYAALFRIVIRNGLPNPDSDADRQQNVISWSLGHTTALRKISSKSVGNSIIQWIRISDYFGLLDPDGDPDRHQNWIRWSLGHALPLQEISSKSVHNFLPREATRSAVLPWQVVRPSVRLSVRLSVCDVKVSWSYTLEFWENNVTAD